MQQRIIGFDLARAYAIFGMFIVNFNFSFGSLMNPASGFARFLNIFTGNSTAIFILCAGMGVSLMTNRPQLSIEEKAKLKSRILKRSWFLFALGLLLYNWWSGDILHFYGGYMHIAAFLLFVHKRTYWLLALAAIVVFHLLLFIIPIETGWDFSTFRYVDFWTLPGFLRNTFYNGWNSIFPWLAYFLVGMWLGRLDWSVAKTKRSIFVCGLLIFLLVQALRFFARENIFPAFWADYIQAEYFPPYLPFMLVTMGYAFMVLAVCMYVGEKFSRSRLISALQKTGQMTLTHYVVHLTLGMLLFAALTRKHYTGLLEDEPPTSPQYIFAFSAAFYAASVMFSVLWSRKFKNGPLETVMRKISG